MPQISLYIDEETLKKVEDAAKRQHVSISKWVAEQIKSKIVPHYPLDYEKLYGSIQDDSFNKPEQLPFISDSIREQI